MIRYFYTIHLELPVNSKNCVDLAYFPTCNLVLPFALQTVLLCLRKQTVRSTKQGVNHKMSSHRQPFNLQHGLLRAIVPALLERRFVVTWTMCLLVHVCRRALRHAHVIITCDTLS